MGLITRPHQQFTPPPNTTNNTITYKYTNECNNPFTHTQAHLTNTTPRPIQSHTNTRTNATTHLHTQTHLTNTTPQTPNTTISPVRATLLHSPGWNEGKARYGTLGTHRRKRIELRRSGTYPRKQMPQRINTLRRKTTNHNDTNQMHAVSAAPKGAQ